MSPDSVICESGLGALLWFPEIPSKTQEWLFPHFSVVILRSPTGILLASKDTVGAELCQLIKLHTFFFCLHAYTHTRLSITLINKVLCCFATSSSAVPPVRLFRACYRSLPSIPTQRSTSSVSVPSTKSACCHFRLSTRLHHHCPWQRLVSCSLRNLAMALSSSRLQASSRGHCFKSEAECGLSDGAH